MDQKHWRTQALARCQAAVWALSEASQALIDARRASETAGDWDAFGRDLDMLLTRLWPIRESLESTRNRMISLDEPKDTDSAGEAAACEMCGGPGETITVERTIAAPTASGHTVDMDIEQERVLCNECRSVEGK